MFKKIKFKRRNIIILILLVLFLILTQLYIHFYNTLYYMFDVTDINMYEKRMNDNLLMIFPERIPKNAKNVNFYYTYGILQAGDIVSLYYEDNNLNSNEFDKKYNNKSIWSGYIKEYTNNNGLLDNIFYKTSVLYNEEDNYKVYLIKGHCDDSGYCNHGNYLLTAINNKTNSVIYKYERW